MLPPPPCRVFFLALLLAASPSLVGCIPPDGPTLCVFAEAELEEGKAPETADCPSPDTVPGNALPDDESHAKCSPVGDGAAFFLRHEMPDGVEPQVPLDLSIETPCGETPLQASHVRGVVLLPRVAPPGAACALTVRAVLQNSQLSCSAAVPTPVGGPDPCDDLQAVCAAAE